MGSFKDVVGHREVIQYLQNAVAENRVSQAYIVNGERGTGKKMLAKLFAMALLCEEHGPEPCNKCHSCVQAESNNHPDIIWVTHEKPDPSESMMCAHRSIIQLQSSHIRARIKFILFRKLIL